MEILEGTWEEIRARDAELAGRHVTVIVSEEPLNTVAGSQRIPGRFDKYIGAISSGRIQGRDAEKEFAKIMDEKQAKDRARRGETGR